jgi:hypothetical protein
MRLKAMSLVPLALAIALACSSPALSAQKGGKKKKKKAAPELTAPEKSAPAEPMPTSVTTPPVKAPAAATPVNPPGNPEDDPQRSAWRIEVAPYAVLGSGRPGKAASDFDKPDGVAFAPNGWLLATDAKNRRVQVWDVRTKNYIGEFGHKYFGGEIVDIATAPDGTVYVTDQTLNLAYAFAPPAPGALDEKGKALSAWDYQFKGTRFGERGFEKLGGIAVDSRGRIYLVDAHLNDVRRYLPDASPDPAWRFERARGDGETYLHGCEGIAIDESTSSLYIASEKDAVIRVFDLETGASRGRIVGAALDATGRVTGPSVFAGAVEGLALFGRHLLAVDESAGQIQVFDLSRPQVFNSDFRLQTTDHRVRAGGYLGYFGHAPLVNFDDKKNLALQQQLKEGSIIPGQANPPGYFCSPDAIAAHTDPATNETYIAIADQCNYRLAVYRWSDLARALASGTVAKNAPASAAKQGKKKKKK